MIHSYCDVWVEGSDEPIIMPPYETVNNSELHRDNDLPAIIRRYYTGEIEYECYIKHGKVHRNHDLPASIAYYKGVDRVYAKSYYKNGLMHRTNSKPAEIYYDGDGSIRYVHYLLFGIFYEPLDSVHTEYLYFIKHAKTDDTLLITGTGSNNKLIKAHCNYYLLGNKDYV